MEESTPLVTQGFFSALEILGIIEKSDCNNEEMTLEGHKWSEVGQRTFGSLELQKIEEHVYVSVKLD